MLDLDRHVIAAQHDFDEPKVRDEFRRVIGHLRTVVIHCFDPRVTGGIVYAVAEALPGQDYPGDVVEFVDDHGRTNLASTTTIFPIVNAGGKADPGALRSIAVACHLFDIDNVVVVHHTDCGGTHFTGQGLFDAYHRDFHRDLSAVWKPEDIGCIKSFEESLNLDVGLIRDSPATPAHVNVFGYAYDIATGNLHLVAHSPGDPLAPRGATWR
jgi:carbonic anhydrase